MRLTPMELWDRLKLSRTATKKLFNKCCHANKSANECSNESAGSLVSKYSYPYSFKMDMMKDIMIKSRPMVFNRFDRNCSDARLGCWVMGSNIMPKEQEK